MSYDPSHRMPPRQERWPQATPAEGWPPYREDEGEQASHHGARAQQAAGSHRRQAGPRSAVATAAFPVAGDAYGTADARDTGAYDTGAYDTGTYDTGAYDTGGYRVGDYTTGTRGQKSYGYTGTGDGYADATDGFDGAPGSVGRTSDSFNGAPGEDAADGYGWARVGYAGSPGGHATAGNSHAGGTNGYARTTDHYAEAQDGYTEPWNSRAVVEAGYGQAETRYGQAGSGYGQAGSGYGRAVDDYAGAANDIGSAPDGYPSGAAYLGPGSYTETAYPGTAYSDPGYSGTGYSDSGYFEPGYSDPMLAAPDAGVDPYSWQADQALRRAAGHRGLMVSAATEVLATAVVIGVSTLAAGLLKSTVSPVSALGTVFIDRTPAMLRGFAMHHFGSHGRAVLLLGMYAVIAVIAIAIGVAARRAAALGVTGVAAFALVVAFVAVTRPASHVSDVMPAVIGGLAGVAALLWLVRASAPIQEVTPLRPARGGTRRRTR
jgi:hypothetical protein